MKKACYFFFVISLVSCTSNTIFEKPDDLIPKDTMSLLIQELVIASSSKFVKNKNLEKNINYMPLVYDRFKIDSNRFQTSNLYYMSKIDLYQQIIQSAKDDLDKKKAFFEKLKKEQDSIRKDSINKSKKPYKVKPSKNSIKEEVKI